MILVYLESYSLPGRGTVHDVFLGKEKLLGQVRQAIYPTCRILRDQGYTGKVVFADIYTGVARAFVRSLVLGARLTVKEPSAGKIGIGKFGYEI